MTTTLFIQPTVLYGIGRQGPSSFNEVEGSGADFGQKLWLEFIDHLVRNGVALDGELYGVSWPADELVPPQQINYFCGLESADPLPFLETLQLDGGNYFVYHCDVPANALDSGFQDAYMRALPESGLRSRPGQHLEIYGDEYDPNSDRARFRILIPVE